MGCGASSKTTGPQIKEMEKYSTKQFLSNLIQTQTSLLLSEQNGGLCEMSSNDMVTPFVDFPSDSEDRDQNQPSTSRNCCRVSPCVSPPRDDLCFYPRDESDKRCQALTIISNIQNKQKLDTNIKKSELIKGSIY
ncbi:hypothetical protein SNE40_005236 [Patella caerulea]|uniref:Uncharacterized protein n=1 Tax=Patella caerulea TaxID=87958 RepID=A0AAN8K7R7_PATCE